MSILIDEETRYLIQGITGKQGVSACLEMLSSGGKVVAGVTPGKAGQTIKGVPVYNTVKEAKMKHEIDATVIYVPPKLAKEAIKEAIEVEIPLINIITENILVHDMAYCLALAKQHNVRIIGASSAGIFSVGKSKSGSIAGGKSKISYSQGNIGVISKSGGMSSETALVLTQAGLGQSTVVSIGGDVLTGDSFVDLIPLFEKDGETKGIVIYGEIGGTAEEDLAEYLVKRRKEGNSYSKPIVAFVAGEFAENFQEISLGHAGAIIEKGKGTRRNKVKRLREAGVIVAEFHHEVGQLMKAQLKLNFGNTFKENGQKENGMSSNGNSEYCTFISKIKEGELIIRGEKLAELVRTGSFSDSIFFLLSGRKANPQESSLFEKLLVSVIDHGMGTTSSMTSRFIISGGNNLNTAVGGGILSIGKFHGGAIQKTMEQFFSWREENADIKQLIKGKKTIYGFGHKVYKDNDPRVTVLLQEMEKLGFASQFLVYKELVESAFLEVKGKKVPLNIDGLIALLLCDFGFDPLIANGIFIIGRTPGLVAQAYEELKSEKPVRRVKEEEIQYLGK